MTISPLYPCGKPCSTGNHSETVKKLALFSAFNRLNYDQKIASLFNGHPSEENAIKPGMARPGVLGGGQEPPKNPLSPPIGT